MDPNYAQAYFGLAEAYRALAISGDVPPNEAMPQAKAAANKVQCSTSRVEMKTGFRLQEALALDSNFWIARLFLGKVYLAQKRYPEAFE